MYFVYKFDNSGALYIFFHFFQNNAFIGLGFKKGYYYTILVKNRWFLVSIPQ